MGYESLFTPFKIGNMEVKNRIGLSPMGTNSAFTNGRKDAQEIDYFIERAKGGTGILYMGYPSLFGVPLNAGVSTPDKRFPYT